MVRKSFGTWDSVVNHTTCGITQRWKRRSEKFASGSFFYELAAKLGHPHAQFMTALMYWNGEGGEIDKKSARYFLNLALAQEYQKAKVLRDHFDQSETVSTSSSL